MLPDEPLTLPEKTVPPPSAFQLPPSSTQPPPPAAYNQPPLTQHPGPPVCYVVASLHNICIYDYIYCTLYIL